MQSTYCSIFVAYNGPPTFVFCRVVSFNSCLPLAWISGSSKIVLHVVSTNLPYVLLGLVFCLVTHTQGRCDLGVGPLKRFIQLRPLIQPPTRYIPLFFQSSSALAFYTWPRSAVGAIVNMDLNGVWNFIRKPATVFLMQTRPPTQFQMHLNYTRRGEHGRNGNGNPQSRQ